MDELKQTLKRRVGIIEVSDALLESQSEGYSEVLKKIMQNIVIVRAEHMYHKKVIEYMGFSKYFDEVDVTGIIPKYQAKVTVTNVDGKEKVDIDFIRVDDANVYIEEVER